MDSSLSFVASSSSRRAAVLGGSGKARLAKALGGIECKLKLVRKRMLLGYYVTALIT